MATTQNDSTGKYTFLRSLSPEQLEELLKADYSASMSEAASEEFVDAIVEVMLEREKEAPSGKFTDTEKAWTDFQQFYHVPDRNGQLLYPDFAAPHPIPSPKEKARRPKRVSRYLAVAAAAILILCVSMVGVQASGMDVFGFLARLTEEVFVYKPDSEYYPDIRDAFVEHHFPEDLVPRRYPKGFVPDEPIFFNMEFATSINTLFGYDAEDRHFSILVQRYTSPEDLLILTHQLDAQSQQQYTSKEKTFFIVSNKGYIAATWSDQSTYIMTISGDLSLREVESIIDSIGG